ncbi:hypothetical protein BKH43_05145 [Helicobacter sp. 13S00401-1]|uniref:ParB/RepB/Spo0J family partition protein n=1 Tax=Helicobacter sp. 13S00401-1 TaxID=1905758 RepID=UPI000BA6F0FF|nr:ParB/RepB/Spo0J family partition protein [Helicobacter sp. 13S00401-1]PAF50288.1 hypothetical protein BKH43_05145 [Helicobacter sp. 13S00401-1]
MAKKIALGRGLGDILGDAEEFYKEVTESLKPFDLDINLIRPNPKQPRVSFNDDRLHELASSIKEHGLLQPVLVYKDEKGYVLIAGERRLRASKLLGLESIKAIVLEDVKEESLRELALIENIQRENLNPLELATSYKSLIDEYGFTHEKLAQKIKKSRTQITNTLRILDLSKATQDYILQGKLTQAHAKVIVGLSEDDENFIVKKIVDENLSVKETENLARELKSGEFWIQTNHNEDEENFKDEEGKKLSKDKLFKEKNLNGKVSFNHNPNLQNLLSTLKSLGFKAGLKKDSINIKLLSDEDISRLLDIIQANIK